MSLVKTSAKALSLSGPEKVATFTNHVCDSDLSTDEVSKAAGLPVPAQRLPRLYLVLAPVEFLILSNLTPEEYLWYSTHRAGNMFRQVMFTEVLPTSSRAWPKASTRAPCASWKTSARRPRPCCRATASTTCRSASGWGYASQSGGLYVGDRNHAMLAALPPHSRDLGTRRGLDRRRA